MPSPQGSGSSGIRRVARPGRRQCFTGDTTCRSSVWAIRSGADGAWRAELREILAEFDNDCRDLSRISNYLLHRELATQIEHEVLRFSDPDKQAVLVIALKHFDSL
jgi:hypothetical protein